MYITGILAAFISPASHSLSNIFDAYITGNLFKKISASVFYANLTNAFGFVFLYLFLGPVNSLPSEALVPVLTVAAINVTYIFPYYAALRTVDTSIVAALFSLEKIFIPLWAYLIVDEVVQPGQYIGFFIILLTSLILNLEKKGKFRINRGFWLMLIVVVLLSFEGTLYKKALQVTDWVSVAFWSSVVTFVLRWAIILFPSVRKDVIENLAVYKKNCYKFCCIEVFDQLGNFGPIFALSSIPVLVETSIGSLQSFFVIFYSFLLARFFGRRLKENMAKSELIKKLIGFIFIGIGINLAIGL